MRLKVLAISCLPLIANAQPLLSIFGGVTALNPSHTQSYSGTDNTQFNYSSQNSRDIIEFGGIFLGAEHRWSNFPFFTQGGLEYSTLLNGDKVNAQHTVGEQPSTFTYYQYQYLFQSRQFLLKAKILTVIKQKYYPYISFGAGPAFNTLGNFKVTTTETGSLNLTPTFESHTQTAFSFSVGLGLDTAFTEHLRAGVGYQFTNLGRAALGNGNISLSNYSVAAPFTLKVKPLYANELFVQITYLV